MRVAHPWTLLGAWKRSLTDPVFEVAGVWRIGIDEVRNQVRVSTVDPRSVREVREIARQLGIPFAALVVEVEEGPRLASESLESVIRPLSGGTIFRGHANGGACTLGIVAEWGGSSVVLGNSHCSKRFFELDDGIGEQSVGLPFGQEVFDNNGWACGWFNMRRCRHADVSAWATTGQEWTQAGRIARTVNRVAGLGDGMGSLTIDATNPALLVSGDIPYPLYGSFVDKIGRVSGWTFGQVFDTCDDVDIAREGKNVRLTCQDHARLNVQVGDSGSPVFIYDGSGFVTFVGIVWGSVGTNGGIFSNVTQLRGELGPFRTLSPY